MEAGTEDKVPVKYLMKMGTTFGKVMVFSKVLVAVAFIAISIVVTYISIGYQKGTTDGFAEELNTHTPSQVEVVNYPQEVVDAHTKIFAGSYDHFNVGFNYPDDSRYEVNEYVNNGDDIDMASISLSVIDKSSDTYILYIKALGRGYCLYEWCMLEKKGILTTHNAVWEYLGSSSYSDAGETAEFKNIYRTYNGEFPLYVVSKEPLDLNNSADLATQIFTSLWFSN